MTAPGLPFVLRAASRSDIPGIVAAHNSSAAPGEDVGFGTPFAEQTFASEERLRQAWQNPNHVGAEEVWVAETDGRVLGYVTLEDRGVFLELVDIGVAGDHQGRGIGTRTVGLVEERARREGKTAVTLGTIRNAAGVPWKSFPWWRRLGYHVTHEEENVWTRTIGPGAREIRMRKDMRPAERVELREVRPKDLDVFFDQQRDGAANRMAAFTAKDPSDRAAFDAHWRRILEDHEVSMKTAVLDGRVVGNVGSFFDNELGKLEVTYWIGREFWGRGLATLALQAFLREMTARPIYARGAADNVASIRVLEKCGFVLVGHGRGFANARGREIDEVVMQLQAPS